MTCGQSTRRLGILYAPILLFFGPILLCFYALQVFFICNNYDFTVKCPATCADMSICIERARKSVTYKKVSKSVPFYEHQCVQLPSNAETSTKTAFNQGLANASESQYNLHELASNLNHYVHVDMWAETNASRSKPPIAIGNIFTADVI